MSNFSTSVNVWVVDGTKVEVQECAPWAYTDSQIVVTIGNRPSEEITLWLDGQICDDLIAQLTNLRAAQLMGDGPELPYDFDSNWIEMGEDGFPVNSDDAEYIKEVL